MAYGCLVVASRIGDCLTDYMQMRCHNKWIITASHESPFRTNRTNWIYVKSEFYSGDMKLMYVRRGAMENVECIKYGHFRIGDKFIIRNDHIYFSCHSNILPLFFNKIILSYINNKLYKLHKILFCTDRRVTWHGTEEGGRTRKRPIPINGWNKAVYDDDEDYFDYQQIFNIFWIYSCYYKYILTNIFPMKDRKRINITVGDLN